MCSSCSVQMSSSPAALPILRSFIPSSSSLMENGVSKIDWLAQSPGFSFSLADLVLAFGDFPFMIR